MLAHLAHALALSSLLYLTSASPTNPSTTPTSAIPTVTAKANINGTVHEVNIADKLAVNPSASTVTSATPTSTLTTAGKKSSAKEILRLPPPDDLYTINYKASDFGGSSYCSSRYKSFWYVDWATDPHKRAASCDAVAYNIPNQMMDWGAERMQNSEIFWGPEKDGTNVCYWHFTCDYQEEVTGDEWAEGPEISYKNVQNIAKAWYDPANWPKGKSPRACGHIMLDRANSINQCKLTISVIAAGTGVLTWM